jgi:hypothetical protein
VVAAVGDGGSVARCGWDRRRGLSVGRGLVVDCGLVVIFVVVIAVADAAVAATLATIVVGKHLGGQCVVPWGGAVVHWSMAVVHGSVAAECERSVLTSRRRRRSKVFCENCS